MIERKAAMFRLYPSPEQYAQMAQIAGACRFVYNLAMEQRRDWYRPGRKISFVSQCREVTGLRDEVDWLKACPVHALQQALKDLDRAYQNFFAGRAGYPKQHKKGVNDSFRLPEPVSLIVKRTGKSSGQVKLPKLGWVPLRGWHPLPGVICNITVSRRAGQWFAAVQCEREVPDPVPLTLPAILDQGWSAFKMMLAYKLADRGGRVVEVNAAYTSQTCSACGCVNSANRLSQSDFACVNCGHAANADTNAAINILRRADSALKPVEGDRSKRPVEAGTHRRAA